MKSTGVNVVSEQMLQEAERNDAVKIHEAELRVMVEHCHILFITHANALAVLMSASLKWFP